MLMGKLFLKYFLKKSAVISVLFRLKQEVETVPKKILDIKNIYFVKLKCCFLYLKVYNESVYKRYSKKYEVINNGKCGH